MSVCIVASKGLVPGRRELHRPARWRAAKTAARGALLLLWVLGPGCAKQQMVTPTAAAPPSSARIEVAELEKTIAEHKAGLRGTAEQRTADAPASAEAPSTMSAGAGPSTRCEGVCRAGQEICTASRRICKIAIELTDPAVTASCQRAERECTDASALCAQCR